ncbi:hypothetical protein SPFM14_00077 [Salmonella phage SPFM14]|nr:hypothetical protein SPFM14_00077 [Salmonella phage SPFM14]
MLQSPVISQWGMALGAGKPDPEVRKLREEAKARIGITVGSFCGFPTPQTEPQYGFESAVQAWVKRNS